MKTYILLLALLFTTTIAYSQFSLRPQAGFNASNLSDDLRGVDFENKLGFQFGVDMILGDRFYVQPGIFWESATNELKEEIDGENNEFTVNRMRIPLIVGYKMFGETTDRLFDIRAFTGPNVSFTLNKDLDKAPLFEKGDFKGSTWGWSVGLGLDLAIFFVDGGYTFGLSEVFDKLDSSARNNLFYANAGLRIGF
jgi:hypothetical protein